MPCASGTNRFYTPQKLKNVFCYPIPSLLLLYYKSYKKATKILENGKQFYKLVIKAGNSKENQGETQRLLGNCFVIFVQ